MNALTSALLALAGRIMPPGQREWHRAMQAESAYLTAPAALAWSIGALITAIRQRFMPMNTGDFHVSRWVMLVEIVGAFGLLTLAWLEISFGASGVIHHTPAIIGKYYLPTPGGTYIIVMLLISAISGLIGPIGLLLGLRYAWLGRAPRNRALMISMIAVLLLQSVVGTIAGFLVGPPGFRPSIGLTVLFVLMPVGVLWHLMHLGRTEPDPASLTPAGSGAG